MHQFLVKRIFFILLMIGLCAIVHAQVYDTIPGEQYQYDNRGLPIRRDSSNETLKHRDVYEDSITIYFRNWDSTRIGKLDSSINDFYSRFPVPWQYHDLGNLGTAAESFIFKPYMKPGFDAGFHAYDIYRYTPEITRFFQTTR